MATATKQRVIANLADLETHMRDLSKVNADLKQIELDQGAEIRRIQDEYNYEAMKADIQKASERAAKKAARVQERFDAIVEVIRDYAEKNRELILEALAPRKGSKTAVLESGEIKYKDGLASVVFDDGLKEGEIVARIEALGHTTLIRVKKTLDKAALRGKPEIVDAIDGLHLLKGEQTITVIPGDPAS